MTGFEYLFSPLTPGSDDWDGHTDLKKSRYAHIRSFGHLIERYSHKSLH